MEIQKPQVFVNKEAHINETQLQQLHRTYDLEDISQEETEQQKLHREFNVSQDDEDQIQSKPKKVPVKPKLLLPEETDDEDISIRNGDDDDDPAFSLDVIDKELNEGEPLTHKESVNDYHNLEVEQIIDLEKQTKKDKKKKKKKSKNKEDINLDIYSDGLQVELDDLAIDPTFDPYAEK